MSERVIGSQAPSSAFIRAFSENPYELKEVQDIRHNGGKSIWGRLGSALSVGFAMLSDDENLTDVKQ